MDAKDIKDRESLERWVENRPLVDSICIAQRAALRMFPLWAAEMDQDWAQKGNLTALPVLWFLLVPGVARRFGDPEVKTSVKDAALLASARAVDAYSSYTAKSAPRRAAAARAAYVAASEAVTAAYAARPYIVSTRAVEASVTTARTAWAAICVDAQLLQAGIDPTTYSLWNGPPPRGFSNADILARTIWSREPETWNFWLRWWDGMLEGRPLDWELQRDVALIPDEDWKKGPAHIAALIADIELRHAIARTPNAEIISQNPATGLLRVETVSRLPGKHLADVVDTLRDAAHVFDNEGGQNGPYGQLLPECQIIEKACDDYAARPLMLFRTCRRAAQRTVLKEQNGDCPRNDPLVHDFLSSISEAASDLLAFDPEVKEAEEKRAAANLTRPSPEDSRALVIAADASAEISEGVLHDELPMDARNAVGDGPEEERQVALYVTKSRLLRILALGKRGKVAIDHVERYPVVYGTIVAVLIVLLT